MAKAVCAIYASDDRWTDDVPWRGGALRLVDLVDYDHYMTPMTVLPPVPAVWGDDWRDEWRRRLETVEPWMLTWLRENRDGPYWRHGSLRTDGDGNGKASVAAPCGPLAWRREHVSCFRAAHRGWSAPEVAGIQRTPL